MYEPHVLREPRITCYILGAFTLTYVDTSADEDRSYIGQTAYIENKLKTATENAKVKISIEVQKKKETTNISTATNSRHTCNCTALVKRRKLVASEALATASE